MCSIINNTVLRDRKSGKEYKFLRVDGVNINEPAATVTECSIFFEPLDNEVSEFNYIELGNRPEGNFYGIKLQQRTKFPKKSNGQGSDSYDYDYYMSQPFTPDTSWHFSNQPYKQIHENILNRSGYFQVKIHFIDCPKELEYIASSITIRTTNHVTKKD